MNINGWDGLSSIIGGNDCNDSEATIYPGATELCDGQLNDCNGIALPTDEIDDDLDGYVECTIDANGWDGIRNKPPTHPLRPSLQFSLSIQREKTGMTTGTIHSQGQLL